MAAYTIGLDYGTNTVRALLVNVQTGAEIATAIFEYPHGMAGVVLDRRDPNLARQHPQDYLDGAEVTIKKVLAEGTSKGVKASEVIGIGVDTTGSTPMPVDAEGRPVAFLSQFVTDPAALAWLWKDHTSHAEAVEITQIAAKLRPQYLAKCGGKYSSEWFWAKILHCARVAPAVFDAAATWVEIADWIPAALCGTTAPAKIKRGVCAAGHKAFYNEAWGGYPDEEFLKAIDPWLVRIGKTLPAKVHTVADAAGWLSEEWAKKTGLKAGIPVAVGAFDVHLGAVGSGIRPGVLVKIMGTSTCDLMVSPLGEKLADVPGLCGIVPASVIPGFYGMEAGQSAVGDIFNWFVQVIQPGGKEKGSHEALTEGAAKLKPGESGLLVLDWHNGNRTVLVDQRLTGTIFGLTLHTTPAEIYRALIEATAFGARVIMERFEEYQVPVKRVVSGGGIASKNPMAMQIYANAMGRPVAISHSAQTCALGSAIAGAVAAGTAVGGYRDFGTAIGAMATKSERTFTPEPAAAAVYDRLYKLYRRLHDAFGVAGHQDSLGDVMKELLNIRDEARKHE
ncbi:MAG TPA: ribulokinase [Phycisphaerae bacterium]|nr:ribulokinase [Phycisphaerae bacterium]